MRDVGDDGARLAAVHRSYIHHRTRAGSVIAAPATFYGLKFAVTVISPFSGTVIVHVMPLHDPLKPVNVNPLLATAISITLEPTGKIARQIPDLIPLTMLHASPPGELETVPLPPPVPAMTVTAPGTATR